MEIIGVKLTISAIALLGSSRLLIATTVAIRLLLLLLGVGVLLGSIRVVLAVAALRIIPQSLVLGVVRKRQDTSSRVTTHTHDEEWVSGQ